MSDLKVRGAPIPGLARSAEVMIEGSVSPTNASALKKAVDRVLPPGASYVSILMRHVAYVNSSACGYLIELASALERRGGALILVEVQPKVKVLFNNLGMTRYFRFEASDEDARAFLRGLADRAARAPRVVPLDGPDQGVEFPVQSGPLRIGTDARSTIPVRHAQVERAHAEVYIAGSRCHVRDLGSKSGTFVGDRRVTDEPLRPGDVIRVGDFRLAFVAAPEGPNP